MIFILGETMKFKHGTRRRALEYEKDLIRYWKKNKTFEKSVDNRPDSDRYVFYDGPPFLTGLPHHGHLLGSTIKDTVARYWTMKGKKVERVWGWDCHGLPAEVFTEKKLGINDKTEIGTKISLEEYITTCRDNMVATGDLWEDTIDRIGRWVDFKGAYKTMDKEYMESVWWAFKELYKKGKIYEGEKVLMYCTRDATPISKAEVAMDNSYQDVTDPSVYVKFRLEDPTPNDDESSTIIRESTKRAKRVHQPKYLLAWTTTPWTLLSNSSIAVNKEIEYVEVEVNGEILILAKNLIDKALRDEKNKIVDFKEIKKIKGEDLVGKSYVPLFNDYKDLGDNAFKIWHADFVTDQDGTGIAHESPAYGEDDYKLSRANNIPWVVDTDESGLYKSGPWKDRLVWDVNKEIAKTLKEEGKAFRIEYVRHSYPHCHRCGTKLMYRAHPSWFMDIEGQKSQMLEKNESINWFPSHIKHGRFENTINSAPDWNLSRDRFWATTMPVWKATDQDGKEHLKVVGSYKELEELSGKTLDDYHRPWVDDITFENNGLTYKRVDKVLDCWFESGSMPFAQFHYPFENKEKFEKNFPGDFIVEYVGQVRAWFYYMHAVSIGLFGKESFKNVIVTGTLAGNDGRKMSKSYGNYTDPNELMDEFSADSLRFLLMSSPVVNGEDLSLQDKDVGDIARKLGMVWNMYDFFTMYAEVDKWQWNGNREDPSDNLTNTLDKWIVSRLHELTSRVEERMKAYDIQSATKPILAFIDDASNWYIRRSRRRFWKSGDGQDKNEAYQTLYYVLTQLSKVMAPFTPFLAEELYRNLTGEESVHLADWPSSGKVNQTVIDEMDFVRDVVNQGLSERSKAQIKVRQPLAKIEVKGSPDFAGKLDQEYLDIIKNELNIKSVEFINNDENLEVELDALITHELKLEGIAREIIRHIQSARKEAGLNVDDRIIVSINTKSDDINKSIDKFGSEIKAEILANKLAEKELSNHKFSKDYNLDSLQFSIQLRKDV